MSESNGLPKGWAEASVGELCGFITSGSRGWASHYSDEGAVFLRIGNLDHDAIGLDMRSIQHVRPPAGAESDRTCVRSQDILVSVTADVGMIGVVPDGLGTAYINQHIALCRPLNGCYSPYIAWFLTSRRGQKQFKEMQRGATKVGLGLDDVRNATVPIAPLSEQHRIVEKIEELFNDLDAGVASLQRAKANLKRYRASVLKSAVEGRLTEEWRKEHPQAEDGGMLLDRILRERREKWEKDQLLKFKEKGKEPPKNWQSKYKEPLEVDTSELSDLPKGWAWATTEQVCVQVTDGEHNQPRYQEAGVPMLTATHVRNGGVSFEKAGLIAEVDYEKARARCAPMTGDVLIVCVGATTGRAGRVGEEHCFALVRSVLLLKPIVAGRYLLLWIDSPWTQAWIRTASGASAQAHFYISDAKRMPIPLPPLAEQEQIVSLVEERLSQIDSAEKTIDAELIRAKRLRQSILKRAFEGNLVPQDPRDEPASLLLERIKASKETEHPKKKAKKVKVTAT